MENGKAYYFCSYCSRKMYANQDIENSGWKFDWDVKPFTITCPNCLKIQKSLNTLGIPLDRVNDSGIKIMENLKC